MQALKLKGRLRCPVRWGLPAQPPSPLWRPPGRQQPLALPVLPAGRRSPYHTSPRAVARASDSSGTSEPTHGRSKRTKKPMLDQLLAEYQGMEFAAADELNEDGKEDDRRHRNGEGDAAREAKAEGQQGHGNVESDKPTLEALLAEYGEDGAIALGKEAADEPKSHLQQQMMSEGGQTLDNLLAEYDDLNEGRNAARAQGKGMAHGHRAKATPRRADRWTKLEGDFSLDDLLAAQDNEDEKATPAITDRSADRESWEEDWKEEMSRFGLQDKSSHQTMVDLVKLYQSQPHPGRDDEERQATPTLIEEEGRTENSRKNATTPEQQGRVFGRQELKNVVKTMMTNEAMKGQARGEKPDAEQDERAGKMEGNKPDPNRDEDDKRSAVGKEASVTDRRKDMILRKEQRPEEDEEMNPLEFMPFWQTASKHLPPRRTEEEWLRLTTDRSPIFADIERSEHELDDVVVTKRFDPVDENETDEQYMERMIREAGEEEEGRTAKPLDPAEAKKRRKKLKRKERRRLEWKQRMEQTKRHYTEANVKFIGSQMTAQGVNVPPELMHWFADPNGLKTKRDLVLEKKCHRLQRKAELRKTRERRIDYPDDTSNVDVQELLGLTRRQKRMATKIQEHLQDMMVEDLQYDPAFAAHDINFNDVIMSRDMRIARVYWQGSGNEDALERLLHKRSPMLRSILAQRAGVRYVPELVFYRESAESMYHEVTRRMDELQKEEGWDETTLKSELKRIRKEREASNRTKS